MGKRKRKDVPRELYHLTRPENVDSIKHDGIRARDGMIFVYTDPVVADEIAANQIGLKRYAVFIINPGAIVGSIGPDDVAEFCLGFQRIIRQPLIGPRDVEFVRIFDVPTDQPTAWEYYKGECMGQSRAVVDARHSIMRWKNEQTRKGELSPDQICEEANRRMAAIMAAPPQ